MKTLFYFESKETGSAAKVDIGKERTLRARLHRDYEEMNDGVYWLSQSGISIKAVYTDRDRTENAIFKMAETIKNGDEVEITAFNKDLEISSVKVCKAKVLGDYSNCVVFEEIA